MSIIIIGDIHGWTKTYQKWINRNLDPSQFTIQIGDMGLGFAGVGLPAPGQGLLAPNNKFFRGNHDDPEKCRAHKNYLGDYGYLPDHNLFWVAGAFSVDRDFRIEGRTWWRDEELSYEELDKAIDLYSLMKPRFVLSHDAPTLAGETLLHNLVGPYFAMKGGSPQSRTAQTMQIMLGQHQPEEWVFGHYHVDKTFYVPNCTTKFTCVGGILNDGEQPHTYELKT
jgi:predicted phosphodiesterase